MALESGPVLVGRRTLVDDLEREGIALEDPDSRELFLLRDSDVVEEEDALAAAVGRWARQQTVTELADFARANPGWSAAWSLGHGIGRLVKPISMEIAAQQLPDPE